MGMHGVPREECFEMSVKYVGYRLAQWLSAHLPTASAFGFAEQLADFQWRWSTKDRAAVQTNLSVILGARTPGSAPLVREVFRNFARYLVEFFTIHQVQHPEVRIEGHKYLTSAQRHHRGAIVLTGHLGNWEVGAALIRRMGFPVTVVALPHDDPRMDQLFNRQRQRCGVNVIPLGTDAARRSLQSLCDGQLLGLLVDREFTGKGLTLSVCGQEITLPRGPATLSLRSQVPVVPTFLIREGIWKFRLWFEPPIWPQTHEVKETAVRMLTQTYAAIFERYLKRFPEQWLMFQDGIWCQTS
jgi:KDO2-lipid IV(A) lauroyltransferase